MKGAFIGIVICTLLVSAFGLTACGTGKAEIHGIIACVELPDKADVYDSTLADETTLADNDFVLRVGQIYHIMVELSASGGSSYPVINDANAVVFKYDTAAMEIRSVTPNDGQTKRYTLVCGSEISYSAILIEFGKYHYTLIVSAK